MVIQARSRNFVQLRQFATKVNTLLRMTLRVVIQPSCLLSFLTVVIVLDETSSVNNSCFSVTTLRFVTLLRCVHPRYILSWILQNNQGTSASFTSVSGCFFFSLLLVYHPRTLIDIVFYDSNISIPILVLFPTLVPTDLLRFFVPTIILLRDVRADVSPMVPKDLEYPHHFAFSFWQPQ